ncbi:DUF58 domain-containing protein [uncultured Nocardioides sp.]|uniref:DUF58 domain-containing protein n=1 Tax=uncultured Nocardioides sp. TaxID=198441 RepID=UPI0025EA68C0|nr:DUF58 domain-containing protein [uncultured Nocardioides sp.]
MTTWRATPALARAVVLAAVGLLAGVTLGRPVVVVLVSPFLLLVLMSLLHRPSGHPRVDHRLDHVTLHEGQGTTLRLRLEAAEGVEVVSRAAARAPYVATRPPGGALVALADDDHSLRVSPRRWGRRTLGDERVALTSRWAGFRFGATRVQGARMFVMPGPAPYDSRAEAPAPVGLVGAHRSRRNGSGTEFSGIRPFATGDRLRRIQWRTSLRTGSLHVVTTRAEEDSAVLVVVDALVDLGRSGGVDGEASSLDLAVRAASSLAEHHVRRGDRVGLRVLGADDVRLAPAAGQRHLRRLQGTLARTRLHSRARLPEGFALGVPGGTVVHVLSPMLDPALVTAVATASRRGLHVVVVDTLPPDVRMAVAEGTDERLAGLAWRMRRLDRDDLLRHLAATGCPVVPWRGPGTLDEVLHRLARRAQLPAMRSR